MWYFIVIQILLSPFDVIFNCYFCYLPWFYFYHVIYFCYFSWFFLSYDCYFPWFFSIVWLILVFSLDFFQSCDLIGDNCIVFENFTASIGDLMVANWVYWRCDSVACKWIFATITIQYSYLHSNVIMGIDLQTVLPHYWQDDVSSNQLKF